MEEVNKLTKTERFDYENQNKHSDKLWDDLYNKFKDDEEINFYNNKIYSRDIENLKDSSLTI